MNFIWVPFLNYCSSHRPFRQQLNLDSLFKFRPWKANPHRTRSSVVLTKYAETTNERYPSPLPTFIFNNKDQPDLSLGLIQPIKEEQSDSPEKHTGWSVHSRSDVLDITGQYSNYHRLRTSRIRDFKTYRIEFLKT